MPSNLDKCSSDSCIIYRTILSQHAPTPAIVYLHNVLRVLCSVLEHGAAVLQVFLIQAECVRVDLLQRRVPELRLLQVDQEVGVDRAALDETHTAGMKHQL